MVHDFKKLAGARKAKLPAFVESFVVPVNLAKVHVPNRPDQKPPCRVIINNGFCSMVVSPLAENG